MLRRRLFAPAAWTALCLLLNSAPAVAQQQLTTPAENSGFTQYTSYDQMMEYMEELRASSPDMWLGTYGQTHQGRDIPYAVFSRPLVSSPAEAWALGRPVLVFNANVHGGERTLRESLMIFMRELVTPGTEGWKALDHVVLVVAPQINPDGFEATANGTRGNSWGIDMNRDWVKREQPALTNYAYNVVDAWSPHILIDGHNGGSFPYHITYQCPSHAQPDQRLTQLCDERIFPGIDRDVEAGGYKSWYYTRGTATRWDGGGWDARIGRNYSGFINTIGILFESPPWQDMRLGVEAGIIAYRSVLSFAANNPNEVMDVVGRARRETIEMGQRAEGEVVIDMEYGPQPRTITYEIGVRNEQTGEMEAVQVTNDSLMTRPVVLKTRPLPYAYILPRDAVDAVAMLRRNSISVEVLTRAVEIEVDSYVIEGVQYEQAYNHGAAVMLELADDPVTRTVEFPAGSYVVRTGQMRGRLVAHMLEPETLDNVIYWNTMDAWLPMARLLNPPPQRPQGQGFQGQGAPGGAPGQGFQGQGGFGGGPNAGPPLAPIHKLMTPRGLPLRIVD